MCELRSSGDSFQGSYNTYGSSGSSGGGGLVIVCLVVLGLIGLGVYKYATSEPSTSISISPPAVQTAPEVSMGTVAELKTDVSTEPMNEGAVGSDEQVSDGDDIGPRNTSGEMNEELKKQLTDAVGDLPAYRAHLEGWGNGLFVPDSAKKFKRVLDEALPFAAKVLNWNQVLDRFANADLRTFSSEDARELAMLTNGLLAGQSELQGADLIQERAAVLQAIIARISKDGTPIYSGFIAKLQRPEYQAGWLLKTKQGHRYYCPERPRPDGDSYAINYIVGPNAPLRSERIAMSDVDPSESGTAPTAEVAKRLIDLLSNSALKNWESTFYRASQTIAANQHLDPIIKAGLLRSVMEVACRGSLPLQHELNSYLELLASVEVDALVNPFDSQSISADDVRIRCEKVIASLPELSIVGERAAKSLDALSRYSDTQRYVWVGWIGRDQDGQWACMRPKADKEPGEELLIVCLDAENACKLVPATESPSGLSLSEDGSSTTLSEGLPVFLMQYQAPTSGAILSAKETPFS